MIGGKISAFVTVLTLALILSFAKWGEERFPFRWVIRKVRMTMRIKLIWGIIRIHASNTRNPYRYGETGSVSRSKIIKQTSSEVLILARLSGYGVIS